jgi:Aspartyl protease/PDZ domain
MRRFRYILLLTLLLQQTAAWAQEEIIGPPSRLITKFKFTQLFGGIIVVRAQVDNIKDTLNFVLDTGSSGISLDSATCAELKLTSVSSDRQIRGIGGIKGLVLSLNHNLRLPGLQIDSLDFYVNNYDILTATYGLKIDGIIGYSFFSRFIVAVNYDSETIEVYSQGPFRYPKGGHLLKPTLAALPVTPGRLRDNNTLNARFIFDTGAGLSLLLSTDFVNDSSLLKKKRKPMPTLTEGLGGKALMTLTVVREYKIGPYKFFNVPAHIFEDVNGITNYPSLAGIVGSELLRRFNMILNYKEKDIYLMPNKHFRDQFDYSYTGLEIYLIDEQIVVVDVMKNSPAEAAGFVIGDIVLAVGNDFSRNIQTYKHIMQTKGEKIKFVIWRNNQPVTLSMKAISIK